MHSPDAVKPPEAVKKVPSSDKASSQLSSPSKPMVSAGVDNNGAQFEEVSLSGTTFPTIRPSESTTEASRKKYGGLTMREYLSIGILFLVNLLNYMDRFTIASVLVTVRDYYFLDDQLAGLIQTVFIIFFMIFAPLFGYFGDRYNRKYIMIGGLSVWILAVIGSTLIPQNHVWAFFLMRGIVGIGEASYSILAPTIIADMFTTVIRSRVLMFFYFAIPVGSGLGFICGSKVAEFAKNHHWAEDWQWGLRVTPIFGLLCIIGLVFILEEPERGKAEKDQGAEHVHDQPDSTYLKDLLYLAKNKTYILSTIGYTAVVFVTGTLSWWAPTAVDYADAAKHDPNSTKLPADSENALPFGVIMMVAGIVGVLSGVLLAQTWKRGQYCFRGRHNPRADALICTIGSFASFPFLALGFQLITINKLGAWASFFIAVTFLCLNWAINVDMLLYVVLPKKRAIATGIQILVSHLFGDASGPYIIGLVSDTIRKRSGANSEVNSVRFDALRKAFYIPIVLLLVSGVAFAFSAWTLVKDKEKFDIAMGYKTTPAKVTVLNGKGTGLENDAFDEGKNA